MGICPKKEASPELGRRAFDLISSRLAQTATAMLTQGSAPAEAVYEEYARAFRHPLKAARTAFGVQSTWEILSFVVGNFLRLTRISHHLLRRERRDD
jgi:hypothetical protein